MANMEITINATPPSPDPPAPSPPAAITSSPTNSTSSEAQEGDEEGNNKKEFEEWVKKWRGWLMAAASLFASVTFQAALNPPGGFWQDDLQGHTAGNPVLATNDPFRYLMFLGCDTLTCAMSVIIIALLLEPPFFDEELRLNLIQKFLRWVFFFVAATFSVGTAHDFKSLGVPVLCAIFIFILYRWEVWRSERKKLRSIESINATSYLTIDNYNQVLNELEFIYN